MAEHNKVGVEGELKARNFFLNLGYQIVETNWRERKYEIDIIARDQDEIVFIEVKTRSTAAFGEPEEAVTSKKQQHLIEGADFYLQEKEIDLECRFDVISLVINANKEEIKHIKNAFYPEA